MFRNNCTILCPHQRCVRVPFSQSLIYTSFLPPPPLFPQPPQWVCVLSHFRCVRIFCDPMNCSPPGSSDHGIFQARILNSVAISSSRGSSPPRGQTHVAYVSCIGKCVLYHQCHLGSLEHLLLIPKSKHYLSILGVGSGVELWKEGNRWSKILKCFVNSLQ